MIKPIFKITYDKDPELRRSCCSTLYNIIKYNGDSSLAYIDQIFP